MFNHPNGVRIANPIFCRRCVTIVLQRIGPAGASATAEQTDKDGKDHTMYYGHNPKFPDNFMWGASSAAWQVEGGVADGGRTPAIIDLNSKTKKPFTDNTYAADDYHHYKEDVALMAECGFSSYRFSLSWSRIIPHADGKVNPEGIAFYNDLINELVAHNITPIVTLYHYDLPFLLCLLMVNKFM